MVESRAKLSYIRREMSTETQVEMLKLLIDMLDIQSQLLETQSMLLESQSQLLHTQSEVVLNHGIESAVEVWWDGIDEFNVGDD